MKPGIHAVYSGSERVLALEEVQKSDNTPAGGDDSNAGHKDTDTECQYQPVNVYILGRPLKYCHSMTPPLNVSVLRILKFCNPISGLIVNTGNLTVTGDRDNIKKSGGNGDSKTS
jgi:hypothetical protein